MFSKKFNIYNGTKSIDELMEKIEALGMSKSKCYYIQVNDMFYAVFYDTSSKEMILGDNIGFYSTNGRLVKESIEQLPYGYSIHSRDNHRITDSLAQELCTLYTIKVFGLPNSRSKQLKDYTDTHSLSKYVVLLALSFCSQWYTMDNYLDMATYFVHYKNIASLLSRTKGAIAINPFTQEIKFKNGSIIGYSIIFHKNYYGYTTSIDFAITDINEYAVIPGKRRKWLSLTQYRNKYSDFIDYKQPDFRKDKTTCKWCGKKLPTTRKSFCNIYCSKAFSEATSERRGNPLSYKILCRDNFTCSLCHRDLAEINNHGIKIPTSRLSDIPDSDGEYRRLAEVHHKKAVSDGGSDNQENLTTLCIDCHLKIECKENKLAQKYSNVIDFTDYIKRTKRDS